MKNNLTAILTAVLFTIIISVASPVNAISREVNKTPVNDIVIEKSDLGIVNSIQIQENNDYILDDAVITNIKRSEILQNTDIGEIVEIEDLSRSITQINAIDKV